MLGFRFRCETFGGLAVLVMITEKNWQVKWKLREKWWW